MEKEKLFFYEKDHSNQFWIKSKDKMPIELREAADSLVLESVPLYKKGKLTKSWVIRSFYFYKNYLFYGN